jgi:hypothetical protein
MSYRVGVLDAFERNMTEWKQEIKRENYAVSDLDYQPLENVA